jgi:hypothetical protein
VTAARASASFPVAFAPVKEGKALAERRVLPSSSLESPGERWLVDGGVLDNAPFEPVLDAIGRRPATEPVRRLLVYVVPSRGAGEVGLDQAVPAEAGGAEDGTALHPPWVGILGGAVGFPREGDVRADMENTARLLAQAESTDARPEVGPEALFRVEVDATAPTGVASGLFAQYRRARALGGLQDVRIAVARAREGSGMVLAPIPGTRLDDLLSTDVPWVPPTTDEALRSGTGEWHWGLGTAERVCRLMVRDLWDRACDRTAVAPVAAALTRVEALRDAVSARLGDDASAESPPADDLDLVAWAAQRFRSLRVQEALEYCVRSAAEGYSEARAGSVQPETAIRAGLAVEVATQAFSAGQPFRRTAPFEFLRLGPDVEAPFVDCTSPTTDEVRAQLDRIRLRGDKKLYGTRMQHFAAFGLPEWRAWDWTAGRLDAQAHLSRALLRAEGAGAPTAARLEALENEATAWAVTTQGLTVRAELDITPAEWRDRREALSEKTDGELLGELRGTDYGGALVVAVVDALMRALPHQLALGPPGGLLNSLLARRPQNRFPTWWAPAARLYVRRKWLKWTATLGASPDRS